LGKAALDLPDSHPKHITVPITGPMKVCSYDCFYMLLSMAHDMHTHTTHTQNVSCASSTLTLVGPQGKLNFSQSGGQLLFMSTYFVRSVVKGLLQSSACANLGNQRGVSLFLNRRARTRVEPETMALFTGLMDKIVRGAFDAGLMEWAGMHDNHPQHITPGPMKKYMETTLECYLGTLLCAAQHPVMLQPEHMFICFVCADPSKQVDVWESLQRHAWYKDNVLILKPQAEEDDAEVEPAIDPPLSDCLPDLNFDHLRSAKEVYARYMTNDALDPEAWSKLDGKTTEEASVLYHYMQMNIHYYAQKGTVIVSMMIMCMLVSHFTLCARSGVCRGTSAV
jgi:hypothetical protein